MKLKDLTEQKFGKLTVLYRAESKITGGKKRTMWHCLCECGNEIDVSSDYLNKSQCPSCGCEATKNRIEKNRINNIGEKFGRLTIVDILWDEDRTKAICKCDCGNDYIGVKTDIVSGHTQSCGCLQSENTSAANTKDWTGCVSDYGVKFLRRAYMNDKGQWLWECCCGLCGNIFIALPAKVNNGHITSCGCRIQSSGEEYIKGILDGMKVAFETQYTFEDCKYVNLLRFDFAIMQNDELLGLIEYDGKQHFEPIEFFGGQKGFEETKKRDSIKNAYCKSHNIPLLRLPYTLSTEEIKQQIYEYYLSVTTAGCA